jgi:hypothetical protein
MVDVEDIVKRGFIRFIRFIRIIKFINSLIISSFGRISLFYLSYLRGVYWFRIGIRV